MKHFKKASFVFTILLSFFIVIISANASSKSFSFSGSAAAFSGKYNLIFAGYATSSSPVKYAKIDFNAYSGNKLTVSYIWTDDWTSEASVVVSTDTLKASDNDYVIYAISENMSCPSDADYCLTVPKKYSTDGKGNDIGYDFTTGFRFVNDSWFYGTLYISGTATLYY